ncbi:MAG: tRNA uridine-5-carboxymethylaminomethyl(34) synthesis enzyme MnmG [Bacteroidales bacterium]|nr:tRNA uridine-5-carboxymethylaminomethyl(34) synthesis enzyme MnmG [Bacteroidales bacterium]
MFEKFDVIVVGAGHAGCEAAYAAAKLGTKTLLITQNLNTIAQMSCNPAMGGIAKGQLLCEIDALGGMSAIVTDHTMIQFRMLNRSKGPAMWSPRAQSDKAMFTLKWKQVLETTDNLSLWQDDVESLIFEKDIIKGVKTQLGISIFSKTIILTNGTFLKGKIHIGKVNYSGGRIGEMASQNLSDYLKERGIEVKRLKTGTPVRVDGRSIDFSKLEEQKGDNPPGKFSFTNTPPLENQISCWMTYTSEEVHDILRTGFDDSPMFAGRIQGVGPRYCPSIEDKIDRFSERNKHLLFIEPEGRMTNEFYINGFSSSLPIEIQYDALRKIKGFENARIVKPGYAIEYDYFDPTQLKHTMETKAIANLFFAGQINGTTGYEEAAAQGLMAGINAHQNIVEGEPFILNRTEAYIAVLIDDIVTKGVDEPYRMFTSRAEHRILLRQNNADERLTPKGYKLGLIDEQRYKSVLEKYQKVEKIVSFCETTGISPADINSYLQELETSELSQKVKLKVLITRPQINIIDLFSHLPICTQFINDHAILEAELLEAEIRIKYHSYIIKEMETANKILKFENIKIPEDIDYFKFTALSTEARQKLSKIRPHTLGQATRISGITPSDISVLLVHFGR